MIEYKWKDYERLVNPEEWNATTSLPSRIRKPCQVQIEFKTNKTCGGNLKRASVSNIV